jgi:sensor histidine kinase regulating citrate/malate metabolism
MNTGSWTKEFPAAITVCDKHGVILELNDKACATFEKDGGVDLIGKNLKECHPDQARMKLEALLQSGSANFYTIEKAGLKKLVFQSPWYENGKYRGLVEISIPIPREMPHFVRDAQ